MEPNPAALVGSYERYKWRALHSLFCLRNSLISDNHSLRLKRIHSQPLYRYRAYSFVIDNEMTVRVATVRYRSLELTWSLLKCTLAILVCYQVLYLCSQRNLRKDYFLFSIGNIFCKLCKYCTCILLYKCCGIIPHPATISEQKASCIKSSPSSLYSYTADAIIVSCCCEKTL